MRSQTRLFVTGASGLVGEGVLHQMLRDDPALDAFALFRNEASWRHASARLGPLAWRVVPVYGDMTVDGMDLDPFVRQRIQREARVVVHAAADTCFSRSLDHSRFVNTLGTYRVAEVAAECRRLDRFVFVSTAFVAGRLTGTILERDNGCQAGWVNAYEQSKYEAESTIRASALPWTVVRPSTIVCRGAEGDIPQINAVHRALRIYHRGLAAMIPGDRSNPVDVVTSSYVSSAIARIALDARAANKTVHLCSGKGALTLGELMDTAYDVWSESPEWLKRGVERAMITDTKTYEMFERAVMETGDVRLRSVLSSLSHFIPQLALPKIFDTAVAEVLLDAPPPVSSYWKPMLRNLIATKWAQSAERVAA